MNKITKNKTIKFQSLKQCALMFVLLVVASIDLKAQCPLVCNTKVQVSMDVDCIVEITPDMMLKGEGLTVDCEYTVLVMGSNGAPIPGSPFITSANLGQTLNVKILNGHNSCWGTIVIEDKLAPVVNCLDDITISCYDNRTFELPTAIDNCTDVVVVKEVANELMDLNCDNEFSARRIISYQATDASNNTSIICQRVITYRRIGLDSIVVPRNYDNIDLNALTCDNIENWDLNGNGYPEITETGVPETTSGFPIHPNTSFCELNATYEDQVIEICGGSFKVLRQWTIMDWCTGEVFMPYQIIKILDVTAPYANFNNPNTVISAESYDCLADWPVANPHIKDYCSEATYTVAYYYTNDNVPIPEGVHFTQVPRPTGNQAYIVHNLEIGFTWIRYKLIDECGNFDYYYLQVEVIDNVAPTAVCDEFTVVTLSNNGMASVWAKTFDDGSHDNCTDITFHARRMDPYVCDSSNTITWKEAVKFCCEDVGEEVMVSMRVTDEHGNTNTCMVIVTVQDKKPPEIFCPIDITIDCGRDIYDLSITGEATAIDNCADPIITYTDVDSLNQCGRGMIWRTWKATDKGGRMATCVQKITVVDSLPFGEGYIDWLPVADVELIGCEDIDTDPEVTGKPEWTKDHCKLIASSYTDQVYTFVDSVCFKIVRTWAIIDWCTYDPDYPKRGGLYRHNQIIKISNIIAPVFEECEDTQHCIYDENCQGYTTLEAAATDDCTPDYELKWHYEVDLYDDGSIQYQGYTNSLTELLPIGKHKIKWIVEDKCGNKSKCEKYFTVVDCKKPTPYCLGEIRTVLMPVNQTIEIWASDFDFGSFDNCTEKEDLYVSFSQDTLDRNRIFTCANVGMNSLEVWITDEAGNSDFCEVEINIQDNTGFCEDGNNALVGNVSTDHKMNVGDVEVTLHDEQQSLTTKAMTDNMGMYHFNKSLATGKYDLTAYKNDNPLNGVSTLDMVIIQQHVLGIKKFESPYNMIAADVNANGTITVGDLVGLRKLVLGKVDDFVSNTSWRFLPNQSFSDPLNPWPFLESIYIDYKGGDLPDLSFMAVKIGDVNNTVNLNGSSEVKPRSFTSVKLNYDIEHSTQEGIYKIPITLESDQRMTGLQMSIEIDANSEFVGVEQGVLDVGTKNVYFEGNQLNLSWSEGENIKVNENDKLFYLIVKGTNTENLSNVILSGDFNSELYTDQLITKKITLEARGKQAEKSEFFLKQNVPNPFRDKTSFSFGIPNTGMVNINIYDLTGRKVFNENRKFNKGINQYELNATSLTKEGVYYLQLEYDGHIETKSFILL